MTDSGKVRVLIVDDSASMRAALRRILASDPGIEVVGVAFEPNMARSMIKDLSPDVVTLDIEMPGMDGLEFLEKIMRLRPLPVVMCSTLTARGAEATIEALRLGAFDCVAKPTGSAVDIARIAAELCEIVKAAGRATVRASLSPPPRVATSPIGAMRDTVIAIGASTGGVEALFSLLSALPPDCPPILVVQHMPAAYTAGFAARLDKECGIHVVEARDGMPLKRGTVLIAPGGASHMLLSDRAMLQVSLRATPPVGGHRPAVDVLFNSMVRLGGKAIGVILTGMGGDGAAGLLAMRKAGAATLAQDQASCVVHGMPRVAVERGAVGREVSLSAMPQAIIAACRS